MFFKNKKVLIAGGTGMIGIQLVKLLLEEGASIRTSSMDDPSRALPNTEFVRADLTLLENCHLVCRGMDYVFNLLGVKGSAAINQQSPANLITPMIQFNTNLIRAVKEADIDGYLFTSSYGAYYPTEILREDDMWKTPSPLNDLYAGHAKRTGELELEAHRIQYQWKNTAIVRPANVYGPFDNFDSSNAMVVPSLIKKAVAGENPLVVYGDGSQIRDFIHAKDVAKGMLLAAKNSAPCINLGSGTGVTIRELVQIIVNNLKSKPEVKFDTSKPSGDQKRVLDISKARALGFNPEISLGQGIKETMEWYIANQGKTRNRYDVFDNK